ncbi:MAG: transcription-repair coupling factor [Bacteroidota bacterium]|nr:transcription-repair coupling factor [Bacteroidota bacterium]
MKVRELVEAFGQHQRIIEFLDYRKNNGQTMARFEGLSGSSLAVCLASVFHQTQQNMLILVPESEEAEFLRSDLEHLISENDVLLLPDSFKKPFDFEELNNDQIQIRAEVISKLQHAIHPYIVVATPESISEKVISNEQLKSNSFEVQIGNQLDLEFLSDFLDENEFEREDFVFQPGQYAIRGGIVDIYSFSNDKPYRIELDGNEIESIRTFDMETQLSIARIGFLTIVPNIQSSSIAGEKISIFKYFDEQTICVLKHFEDQYQYLAKQWETLLSEEIRPENYLLTPREIKQNIQQIKTIIEVGAMNSFKAKQTFKFNTSPQPLFQKNIEMLLSHLQSNELNNIKNLVFSETGKQIERLQSIIEDRQKQINIVPIYHGLAEGFLEKDLKLACYTEHQLFERYYRFKTQKRGYSKSTAMTLKELSELQVGDYVTHIDHGVGKFMGLQKTQMNGVLQEAVKISYRDGDLLFINVNSLHKISKFTGKDGTQPSLHKLGSGVWEKQKASTKKKVKDIARELIALYAKRRAQPGYAFAQDSYLQVELEASFLYEDTPDQAKATEEIKRDMETTKPMDRLLCGDVGFGKTEVAIRAAFKAVADSKQVAVLVPTTILAHQHYRTFKERLKGLPVNVDYINRFKTAGEQTKTLKKVKEGQVDILIGTHRIVGKDIKFKDLGLLIIDEEQKFGVGVKDKLKEIRANVDTLTLTATPIPRTLHFSLMGARDLSVINTPPPNRFPIKTELHTFDKEVIQKAIKYEISRGGQVYFVHNRVKDIFDYQHMIEQLVPGVRVAVAHGQMEGSQLEDVMLRFMEGDDDVLIATTIIEAGLDIPNCNTIIINQAHMFGLSDLHQMRGRVGRSNKKAYCYLLSPPISTLTSDAKKRLSTIEEYSDLGGGFHVAMRDLDIRGAGNLLGGEQSGFISDIGFDTYHKILDEAIRELKHDEFSDLFKDQAESVSSRDCQVDTDFDMLIPDTYIRNMAERLSLYTELSKIENDEALDKFAEMLIDRFGRFPKEVGVLLASIRVKWLGKSMGFEKIVLEKQNMKIYFPSNEKAALYDSSAFMKILQHIALQPNKFEMKQSSKTVILMVKSIKNIREATAFLEELKGLYA